MSQENGILIELRDQLKNTCIELKKNQKLLEENPSNGPRQIGDRDYEMPVKSSKDKVIAEAQALKENLVKALNENLLDADEKEYWDKFNKTIFNQWKDHDLCSSCDSLNTM